MSYVGCGKPHQYWVAVHAAHDQSIFIGARAEGLDTCGQAIFTWYHRVIRQHLPIGDNELLACGLSLGFADQDAPENELVASKLSVESFTTFLD